MPLYFKSGKYDRRYIGAFSHLIGRNFQKTFVCTQYDLFAGVNDRESFWEVELLLIGGAERVVFKSLVAGIKSGQGYFGNYPKVIVGVFRHWEGQVGG